MIDIGGLTSQQWILIEKLLKEALPHGVQLNLFLFGSRAIGTNRPYSDVDLLLESTPPITDMILTKIKDNLEESNLPYIFDLVRLEDIIPEYKQNIFSQKKLVCQIK